MRMFVKKILSLFPTEIPGNSVVAYEAWIDSIIELTGPLADRRSLRFAISTMVLHLGPQRSTMPKNYFVRSLRKTAANQVAYHVMEEVKRQQAEEQAEINKKIAEDTAKKDESAHQQDQEAAKLPTA